jgi:hypothetical protein
MESVELLGDVPGKRRQDFRGNDAGGAFKWDLVAPVIENDGNF